jgi:hypothetical protein
MKIDIIEVNGSTIATVDEPGVVISSVDDALDLLGNAGYLGAGKVIVDERNLSPDFFELKTKLAGEILQKFSNYRMKLAIVGDHQKHTSKSLTDFIYESNKAGHVSFVNSFDEATGQ